jgi:hypothetical protein
MRAPPISRHPLGALFEPSFPLRKEDVVTEASQTGLTLVRRAGSRRVNGDRALVEQIDHALDLLQGKWKVDLVSLMARGIHRHCELLEALPAPPQGADLRAARSA